MACTPHSIHVRRLNSLPNYIDELRHSVKSDCEKNFLLRCAFFLFLPLSLPSKPVQRASLPLERVDDVHSGHRLLTPMFGICNRVSDNVL